MRYDVTYEVVTPESARDGDIAESGFVARGVSLRDAAGHLEGCDYLEPNCRPVSVFDAPDWVTGYRDRPDGGQSRVSVHFPPDATPSSRVRLARLLGAAR